RLSHLILQKSDNGRRTAGDTLAHFYERVQLSRSLMHRAFAAAMVEKMVEALMPYRIRPAANLDRCIVGFRDENEAAQTDQRSDGIFRLRLAPYFAKAIGEFTGLVGGIEAHDIQSLARCSFRAHRRVYAVPD